MFRNYLTVGVRALTKHRAYAIINILGLAIGMAACLLILLYVRYETNYDKWLPNAKDTYQLQSWYDGFDTGTPDFLQMTSFVSGEALQKDFPQVVRRVWAGPSAPVVAKDGSAYSTKDYLLTDGNLLDVLEFPLLRGDRRGLDQPNTIVLSRSEAVKWFGSDDVVGKTMSLIAKGVTHDYRVVGVMRDLPKDSHLKANAVMRVDIRTYFAKELPFLTQWGNQGGYVYVRLRPGTDARALEAQFPAWEKRNIPDENVGNTHFNQGDHQDWHLINVADIHLGKGQGGASTPGNDHRSITTFAIVALLILGMAVVNFTNLATARASQRAREVALRKVLGASRRQLIGQFIGESVLVSAIAMLIALALVEMTRPALSAFLDADLRLSYVGREGVLLPVIALVLLVGVLGGLYPAFFLSRFQPAAVLRANRSAAETPGSGRVRAILVVGQFAVSIGLIICTAVVYAQTVYARSVDPGYDRGHILQVEGLSRYQLIPLGTQIAERMRRIPGVDAVGRTGIGVATTNNSNSSALPPASDKQVVLGQYAVDGGFKDAMGLQLIAGRWFDEHRPADDMTIPFGLDPAANDAAQQALAARGANVVLNASAARRLGFAHPADAIGKQIRAGFVDSKFGWVPTTIIGVVKDSRFRSVREPLDPIMFMGTHEGQTHLIVRYHGDPVAVRAAVEQAWNGITREVPFEAKFSEDIVGQLYQAEEARAKTFAGFSVLSVIVGCLGLFGLASFTAERRTKEIGIRKVLGARTRDIVRLLVWQFSRPVLVANLVAWPIAWWAMRSWLDRFDARIALTPVPFLVAGLLALVIAVATIAAHAIRVAQANPVRALRYE